MEDVARAVGLSRAAVSMALRGDPSIPDATRERIIAAAQRLGYRTNPLVSALMSLQRRRRPLSQTAPVIAVLSAHPPSRPWHSIGAYRPMHEGMQQAAELLGVKLAAFPFGPEGLTAERLRQILHTRRIDAAIIAPLPHQQREIALDLSRLAVVGLGMSVRSPTIERVANDHFQSALLAMQRCHDLGYRRIGFLIAHETSDRLDHRWLSGILTGQHLLRLPAPIAPLIAPTRNDVIAAIPAWAKRQRPEVVILGSNEASIVEALPRDVAWVDLAVDDPTGFRTGIYQNGALLGRRAVELALARLQAGQFSPLEEEHLHLIAGRWVPGQTAPGPGRPRPLTASRT